MKTFIAAFHKVPECQPQSILNFGKYRNNHYNVSSSGHQSKFVPDIARGKHIFTMIILDKRKKSATITAVAVQAAPVPEGPFWTPQTLLREGRRVPSGHTACAPQRHCSRVWASWSGPGGLPGGAAPRGRRRGPRVQHGRAGGGVPRERTDRRGGRPDGNSSPGTRRAAGSVRSCCRTCSAPRS